MKIICFIIVLLIVQYLYVTDEMFGSYLDTLMGRLSYHLQSQCLISVAGNQQLNTVYSSLDASVSIQVSSQYTYRNAPSAL